MSPGPRHLAVRPWMVFSSLLDPFRDQHRRNPFLTRVGFSHLPDRSLRRLHQLTRRQQIAQHSLYEYGLLETDRALGTLFESLEERGLLQNSLFILLSDHGEAFSLDPPVIYHGLRFGTRAQLHDRLTRVPAFIRFPGTVNKDQVYRGKLQIHDLFPLLFDHLGIRTQMATEPMQDRFFSKILQGDTPPGRKFVFGELTTHLMVPTPFFSIRGNRYRMTGSPSSPKRAFWKVYPDPGKEHVVGAKKVPPEIRRRLRNQLTKLFKEYRELPADPYSRNLDISPQLKRKLKGMGYL